MVFHFNPMDPEFVTDPYPTYHRLRSEDPVHESPLGFWVLTRYEDVVATLRDPRFAKEPMIAAVAARLGFDAGAVGISMLDRDPPDHTRLRGLASKAFTPRVVERLRPRVQEIVDGLLDRVERAGTMDLIEEFAYPIPVNVICEMLGVPVEDHEQFKGWSLDLARGLDSIMLGPESDVVKRSGKAREGLSNYIRQLIGERRSAPRGDLLSALIAAEEAGDKLSTEELESMAIAVLIAGTDTTRNQLACTVALFTEHPDQWTLLAERPELAPRAVEESMRLLGAIGGTSRFASEDVEFKGVVFPKDTAISASFVAANRDEHVFADPETFDITRESASPHLTFGSGIHYCLGAWLARAELQEALPILARRLPDLTVDGAIEWKPNTVGIWGPARLPLAFTPN